MFRLLHTSFDVPRAQSFTVPYGFRLVTLWGFRVNQEKFTRDIIVYRAVGSVLVDQFHYSPTVQLVVLKT